MFARKIQQPKFVVQHSVFEKRLTKDLPKHLNLNRLSVEDISCLIEGILHPIASAIFPYLLNGHYLPTLFSGLATV